MNNRRLLIVASNARGSGFVLCGCAKTSDGLAHCRTEDKGRTSWLA
jgi:hypothetical protein